MPVLRLQAQSSADGVAVKVVDLMKYRGRLDDIAVIAARSLPEAVVARAVGLTIQLARDTLLILPHHAHASVGMAPVRVPLG